MADTVVHIEVFTELEGFLIVRGWALDAAKRAPGLTFRDIDTGDTFDTAAVTWYPRPDVKKAHRTPDDLVGFRAALPVPPGGEVPFDPARLEITTKASGKATVVAAASKAKAKAASIAGRGGEGAAGSGSTWRAIDTIGAMNGEVTDASYHLMAKFLEELSDLTEGAVLEIGSRARSGHSRKELVAEAVEYIGLDVMDGPSVDIVGDAHELSSFLAHDHFTHAFSVSVWEHLMVPWKVSIELNKVLKVGGVVMVSSHQAWPVHDSPSDYWRFSEWSWKGLFNRDTGFEIVEVAMGIPGKVLANAPQVGTVGLGYEPAYLSSSVLVRKTGPALVTWTGDANDAAEYPE